MKFDIVIGNPSYNKALDIQFVDLGYKLSKQLESMIVPAKWQSTSDDYSGLGYSGLTYSDFRKLYVKHMRYICFYPACKDIFDILQVDGITYILLDKNLHDECIIENRCKYIKAYNGIEKRSILNRETLINVGSDLVNYLGEYSKFHFMNTLCKLRYCVWTGIKVTGGGLATMTSATKNLYIASSYIEDNSKNIDEHSDSTACIFTSNNYEECLSFLSWLYTRFTRFFVAINVSKLTNILTDDYFRFVPAPPNNTFDHIFTDKELYEYFNITKEQQDIIESIVKERDIKEMLQLERSNESE